MKYVGSTKSRRRRQSMFRPAIEAVEQRLLLSTYTVSTLSDAALPPSGLLTLRQAITDANTHLGSDTILFAPGLFPDSTQQTITLTQGQLTISDAIGVTTITGPGSTVLAISGNNASRVFNIAAGANLSLSNLTVTDGLVAPTTAGENADGGAIFNAGALSLTSATVSNSSAQGPAAFLQGAKQHSGSALGGGIYSTGPMMLTNSTISGNDARGGSAPDAYQAGANTNQGGAYSGDASGGGIYTTALLTLTNSTVTDNFTAGGNGLGTFPDYENAEDFAGNAFGGGITSTAPLTISGGAVSLNAANGGLESQQIGQGNAYGGALYATAALTITNTTFFTNAARAGSETLNESQSVPNADGANAYGGAIDVQGLLTINGGILENNFANGGSCGLFGNQPGSAFGGAICATNDQVISNSTISGNFVSGASASGVDSSNTPGGSAYGGAIDGTENLSISNSHLFDNTATAGAGGNDFLGTLEGAASGGAIWEEGSITVTQSFISGNSAVGGNAGYSGATGGPARGGGILDDSNPVTITDSTISGNSATGGNGVTNYAHVGAGGLGEGAGLFVGDNTTLTNDTIADNSVTGGAAGHAAPPNPGGAGGDAIGGGIFWTGSSLKIADCTITDNSAVAAPGGAAYDGYPAGPPGQAYGAGLQAESSQVVITNSILSANTANSIPNDISDVSGHVSTTSANNLIGVGGGLTNGASGNKVGINNPQLLQLGDYGGPTESMLPLSTSPVIDAGNNSLIPPGITTDQRGYPRIVGKSVDIGAVEFQTDILGTVYNDTNGNGVQTPGESGISNVTVYDDLNNNGKLDPGEPQTKTNADGQYTLSGVPIGPVIIRQVLPNGTRQTSPSSNLGQHATTALQAIVSGMDFQDTTKIFVSGTVFNDTNKNGKQDPNESGLSGWTIYADLNNDGKFESNEPSKTVGANGSYSFLALNAGTYIFRVIPPPGWTQTFPTNNFGQHVTLSSGGVSSNLLFGFAPPATTSISGTVFDDINKNGKQDSGETGISGWEVFIDLNNNGKFISGDPMTTTDADGDFTFNGLLPGTYIVRVIAPSGWSQTTPANGFGQHITLASRQMIKSVLFGEKKIA